MTEETRSRARSRAPFFLTLVFVIAVGLAVAGIVPRVRAANVLEKETAERAVPLVETVVPKRGAPSEEIVLPGNVQAFADAAIFARTNGYVKRWYADLGARVAKGQLLAEIDTPEVDRQLDQARADLQTATATSDLAEVTAGRAAELRKTDSIAQQDADNASGDAKAKRAMVLASRANVKRLEELQSFEKVYAPFAGVVTARNLDVGQLVDTAGGAGTARELYHIAETATLRVFVNVPQSYARAARPGVEAYLTLSERPGERFPGKLVRTANAIDVASRTLRAEVDLDNRNGALLPGAFSQVHLRLTGEVPTLVVPVSALLYTSQGLRVGALVNGDRVHLAPIVPGRDFGNEIEVLDGLLPQQPIVNNPPDSLVDGEQVRTMAEAVKVAG